MINFTSQVFPQQILYCSDRGKRKSKDSFSDQTKMISDSLLFQSDESAVWLVGL